MTKTYLFLQGGHHWAQHRANNFSSTLFKTSYKIKPTVLCQTHRLNLTMPTPSLKATYPQPSLTPTLHLSAHLFAVRSPHSTAPSLHAQPALMHCSWGRFWGLRNAQASPGFGSVEDMVPAVQTRSISRNY